MLEIEIPNNYEKERFYIFSVIFTEFLGLGFTVKNSDRLNISITLKDDSSRRLVVADKLFTTSSENWLKLASLPEQPLKIWNLQWTQLDALVINHQIPVIYGDDPDHPDFFVQSEDKIYLGLDVFGSAFFMLTRYEEIVKSDRDRFDRFPASSSLAYQEKFLERPIINEYLEIFWACLQTLWKQLSRKNRKFEIHLTHDVDEPFRYALTGVNRLVKRCSGDLIKRHSLKLAYNSLSDWLKVKKGQYYNDPCYSFDKIMDISERNNLKSTFYFITDDSGGDIQRYDINHPLICRLLKNIYQRGHYLGLHSSYNTYKDPQQTQKEFKILRSICDHKNIVQAEWGNRQHFLRWESPTTFQNLDQAGVDYDTTLYFPEQIGFRCGVCYEFTVFNVITRRILSLKERPLIVMDGTLIGKSYMNLDLRDQLTLERIINLKKICQLFSGNFVLLWHNSMLTLDYEYSFYQQLIDCLIIP